MNGLGLKNSFRERVYGPLQQFRGTDGNPGKEIGLMEFIQKRAINTNNEPVGLTNAQGNPVSWEDLWTDLGIDPAKTTLDNLISYQGSGMEYLAPEMVRQFILEGLETDASYKDLIAGEESVDSLVVTAPWIKMADETPQTVAEAEVIPESGITWGEKSVKMAKDAIAIHWTDELILSVKLPLLRYWLRKVGVALQARLFTRAVTTLINGDQADASDACNSIGSASGTAVAYTDFLRAWLRGQLIGMRWETILSNETTAHTVMQLSEFANPQGAGSQFTKLDLRNRIIPSMMPYLVSSAMADGSVMLLDKRFGMLRLNFRGLLVEAERIIMRQISGTAASILGGFLTIDNNARLIIDGDAAFVADTSTDFPSTMAPLV